jgi:hypothetical protein
MSRILAGNSLKTLAIQANMRFNLYEIRNHNLNRETHVILVVLQNCTDPRKPCCWIICAVIEYFDELADLHQKGRLWLAALACNHLTHSAHIKPCTQLQRYHCRVIRLGAKAEGKAGSEEQAVRGELCQRIPSALQRSVLQTLNSYLKIHSLPSECHWGVGVVNMLSFHQFGFCKQNNSPSPRQFYKRMAVYNDTSNMYVQVHDAP